MSATFDGYQIELRFDEDDEWLAYLLEMPNVSAFGETPEEALQQLAEAFGLVKEVYEEQGRPMPERLSLKKYSGQFNVRIDKRLHRELVVEAARAGISLNALVAQKLGGWQSGHKVVDIAHPAQQPQLPGKAEHLVPLRGGAQAKGRAVVRLRPSSSDRPQQQNRLAAAHLPASADGMLAEKAKAFVVNGSRFRAHPDRSGSGIVIRGAFEMSWTHFLLGGRKYRLATVANQPDGRVCKELGFGDLIMGLSEAQDKGEEPRFVS